MTISRFQSAVRFVGHVAAHTANAAKQSTANVASQAAPAARTSVDCGVNSLRANLPTMGKGALKFGGDVGSEAATDFLHEKTDFKANTRPSGGSAAYQLGKAGVLAYLDSKNR